MVGISSQSRFLTIWPTICWPAQGMFFVSLSSNCLNRDYNKMNNKSTILTGQMVHLYHDFMTGFRASVNHIAGHLLLSNN